MTRHKAMSTVGCDRYRHIFLAWFPMAGNGLTNSQRTHAKRRENERLTLNQCLKACPFGKRSRPLDSGVLAWRRSVFTWRIPHRHPNQSELPLSLSRLERRCTAWRAKRRPGQRIPKSLWKSAADAADQCVRFLGCTPKVAY